MQFLCSRMKKLKESVAAAVSKNNLSKTFLIEHNDEGSVNGHMYNCCWDIVKGNIDIEICFSGFCEIIVSFYFII